MKKEKENPFGWNETIQKLNEINLQAKPINENKELGCSICSEVITDCEIRTNKSGWFSITEGIKFCPWCGRRL